MPDIVSELHDTIIWCIFIHRHDLSEIEEETRVLLNYKNHLVFNRKQFFLLVFMIFIGPFIAYNIVWIDVNWQSSRWNIPIDIWGNSVAYTLWPILILLVIFLTPEKFEPLIPKKSTILLGIKPFIKVIPHYWTRVENQFLIFIYKFFSFSNSPGSICRTTKY